MIKVLCVQAVGGCLGYQLVFLFLTFFDPGNAESFKIGHLIVFSLKCSTPSMKFRDKTILVEGISPVTNNLFYLNKTMNNFELLH